MTDLLGLLSRLHIAAVAAGAVHIVSTTTPGMSGVVDHTTKTIHIDSTLPVADWYAALAEGLNAIASRGDPVLFGMETFGEPMTADGARVYPMWPRLRLVDER